MGAQIRVYRQKISSTQSMKKIFKAMEMIATSRISKSRQRLAAASPYANALTRALSQVLSQSGTSSHPMLNQRTETSRRSAVVVFSSDRGLAGAYSANVLKKTDKLMARFDDQGTESKVYLIGRKAKQNFDFRDRDYERAFEGDTDSPQPQRAEELAELLVELYTTPYEDGGIDEIHLVYTRFDSLVTQTPSVLRLLPLEVVDANDIQDDVAEAYGEVTTADNGFDFEPSPEEFLDVALPRYIRARIYSSMCHAAASELASRQRAMKAAGDNAGELINKYTRQMNNARQAEVTTELTEIVSATEAL
ncbi:F0F1 ATP synthase subunit gamma [Kocuria sp. p3-SID1433]|uniref:F0F1 ATP synthase subunit gamma n=1 Tax=unclassified Kocuria TaxID=2649579 RepID=UPI0021A65CCE|nr:MULTISPECIES: F0F1 ATP synthase subunit gamma [unclassified Kocuria]MCT1602484.1 F0F1 ATP synthase subunit gamma [Kocuria sp. p3-SID1428]MCT2180154.1 F0F1 ATP synthase subunit gamma [Kocuria sp. p3-SID1433]